MANQYVNKVVQSNGVTLIDISDTTAVASEVAEGKFFYLATGEKIEGTSTATLTTEQKQALIALLDGTSTATLTTEQKQALIALLDD